MGNVAELFDENGSIIIHYDLKPNIYSDQNFSQDTLNKLSEIYQQLEKPKTENINNFIFDSDFDFIQMIVDGAYYSFDLAKDALSKGIKLIPGQLAGKNPDKDKMSYSKTLFWKKSSKESKNV